MAEAQIYKATYSSVPVYETPCQGVAVMRRKADSWLNATQILKVAGFDKPQRTRVLEREVQKGTHEKVQGGYGKYQGTWVPMERGIALARQYGVDRLLQPIFDYIPTADSPPLAPKHVTAPPLRPKKKTAAQAHAAMDDADVPGLSLPQQKSSRVAINRANAARKAAENKRIKEKELEEEERIREEELLIGLGEGDADDLGGGGGSESDTPSPLGTDGEDSEDDEIDAAGDDEYTENGNGNQGGGGRSKKRKYNGGQQQQHVQQHHQQQQHQQQQHHLQQQQQQQQQQLLQQYPQQQPHHQLQQQQHHQDDIYANPPPTTVTAHAQMGLGPLRYARMILDYFVSESTAVPSFLVTPPPDFDPNVVIDDDGHTALHWACAMGRIRIVKLLLTAGADIFRANSMGQTALMRSVMFTNNYDLRKFPELFELLHRSTINIDRGDRTVFHYIVDIALQKGKTAASRYYIENVLGRLRDYPKEVADILNFQDEEGETALTLAARARSKRLVKILLDNGADPKIANRDGKTAEDYILEDERFREGESGLPGVAGAPVLGAGATAASGGSGVQHQPLAMLSQQLHTSVAGQQISTTTIPTVVNLLESLANSFDTSLATTEKEISQADSLLRNIEGEVEESKRVCENLQAMAQSGDGMDERERALREELENRMGKRFRLGWEKWVRDEDQREQVYEKALLATSSNSNVNVPHEKDLDDYRKLKHTAPFDRLSLSSKARKEIEENKLERVRLFEEFSKGICESGTGRKMGVYRNLIALGCGVPLDRVDGVIQSLLDGEEAFA